MQNLSSGSLGAPQVGHVLFGRETAGSGSGATTCTGAAAGANAGAGAAAGSGSGALTGSGSKTGAGATIGSGLGAEATIGSGSGSGSAQQPVRRSSRFGYGNRLGIGHNNRLGCNHRFGHDNRFRFWLWRRLQPGAAAHAEHIALVDVSTALRARRRARRIPKQPPSQYRWFAVW